MTAAESTILEFFRQYQIGPAEMLFFNPGDCKLQPGSFASAMRSLIERGMVVKERPALAYSLTRQGYRALLSIKVPEVARKRTNVAR